MSTRAEVKEGAKACQIIMHVVILCIKPEMSQKRFL